MARGRKTGGGSRKGRPNKVTLEVQQKLDRLGCDPTEGMARIALGDVPCPQCEASGLVTMAQLCRFMGHPLPTRFAEEPETAADELATCPQCGGSGYDPVSTQIRLKAYAELQQYVAPKRKAIEHSGQIELPTMTIGKGVIG